MDNKISFTTDDGERIELYVIEETKLNGNNYLLVAESVDDEESTGYIMKEKEDSDKEMTYIIVEDEVELSAVADVFDELLEDEIDIMEE